MTYRQEPRLDFWNILKRRKRSIRNFLETNGIDNENKFNNWLKVNSTQYIFSEEFKKEVLSHFGEKDDKAKEKIQKVESKEETVAKTEEQSDPYPPLSTTDLSTEIEFTVSAPIEPSEDGEPIEKEYKKNKKKKSYNFDDI